MALQTKESFPTGIVANEAYTVIMQAQINKVSDCVEAEVHVYYDAETRLAGYVPLNRFAYKIYGNQMPRQDTTLWLNLVGTGVITITNNEEDLVSVEVTEQILQSETKLQDIAELLKHDLLEVTVSDNNIIVKATDTLKGSAGAGIDIQGDAVQVISWIVGSNEVKSDLESFTPEFLSQAGVNLQQQIYEHMKANDPRYIDAIDV